MLTVKNLEKSFGSHVILSDVSFTLSKGRKVALVGSNGAGKTTLLRILAGAEKQDAGSVEVFCNSFVGYLPQDTSLAGDETVVEYLGNVTGITPIERELEDLSQKMEDSTVMKRYEEVRTHYELMDGYTYPHRRDAILSGFDLDKYSQQPLNLLSSGQKSKVFLAGILLKGIDLLLLDEPTNNLDLPTLIWLEDYLVKSNVTCVVISHDRRFLDRIVRTVFELDAKTHTISITHGRYTDYLVRKEKELESQKEAYRLQQEEIERLTEQAHSKRLEAERGSKWQGTDNDKFLRGFKQNRAGKSSKVAKAIEKRVDQMDKIERPVERRAFEIELNAKAGSGALKLVVSNLVAGYDNGFTIGPVSFTVNYGERVGIIGSNGVGKSTLLKAITGELKPKSGHVEVGSGIIIGNMTQEHQMLPRDKSPHEYMQSHTDFDQTQIYTKLVQFGIEQEAVKEPISKLSPGERARLTLCLFSALSVNLLILDEPTNHLDIEALDALERTVFSYKGSILLVSHDRYFLEKTRLDYSYILANGELTRVSLGEYLEHAEQRASRLLKLF